MTDQNPFRNRRGPMSTWCGHFLLAHSSSDGSVRVPVALQWAAQAWCRSSKISENLSWSQAGHLIQVIVIMIYSGRSIMIVVPILRTTWVTVTSGLVTYYMIKLVAARQTHEAGPARSHSHDHDHESQTTASASGKLYPMISYVDTWYNSLLYDSILQTMISYSTSYIYDFKYCIICVWYHMSTSWYHSYQLWYHM